MVRVRRPGPEHPGRAAPVHGRTGRRQGHARAGRGVARAQPVGARGRRRDDPRSHRGAVSELVGRTSNTVQTVADRCVDPAAARAVAAAYADARTCLDPLTRGAHARLAAESDRMFGLITSPDQPDPVRVRYTTCPDPYRDARELIASVTDDRLVEVPTGPPGPPRR